MALLCVEEGANSFAAFTPHMFFLCITHPVDAESISPLPHYVAPNARSSFGSFSQLHLSCLLLRASSMIWAESALPDMPQVLVSQALDDDGFHAAHVYRAYDSLI